jgi:hypothetical protein
MKKPLGQLGKKKTLRISGETLKRLTAAEMSQAQGASTQSDVTRITCSRTGAETFCSC